MLDCYEFKASLVYETPGEDVTWPLEFSIILAPDADEGLIEGAAKAVLTAIVTKMRNEEINNG